ncbi:hypothetical protein EMIHUDRAFT_449660 [Emiliania huxleyi CCMP1516]|uniref:HSF-type DNA-binding domain-containing protein n=2 Tax=Emiliania huxleyi TaxID=2903 RepID=A0A0D3K5Q3_EMIH1|nr:hypothetical protein EMIHUDRAFT_449660 [Emiliania huxleyi CCMP1516]EOD31088.1 hypothetical protein EMIHUDRAFT_449660 [Emiliania huxleyi CCMP1516]|eukprot:XP_005783517.1 hypothetical protein EMIHUDRAFT_449660 [Emiliania huxleyi CCMP1516]
MVATEKTSKPWHCRRGGKWAREKFVMAVQGEFPRGAGVPKGTILCLGRVLEAHDEQDDAEGGRRDWEEDDLLGSESNLSSAVEACPPHPEANAFAALVDPAATRGDSPPRKMVAPFLIKLFEIVSSPASDNLVCWSEHGESFKIDVLPLYFKHDNLRSFIRQLNIYGFQRCQNSSGRDRTMEFFHPMFTRNGMRNLKDIKRGNQSKKNDTVEDGVDEEFEHDLKQHTLQVQQKLAYILSALDDTPGAVQQPPADSEQRGSSPELSAGALL